MPRVIAFSILSLIAFLTLAGCGGGMGEFGATSAVKVKSPVKLQVHSPYFVSDLKQSLYERLRDGEAVPFGEVTQALVKDHHINWIERHKKEENLPELGKTYKKIQDLAQNLPSDDLGDIKVEVEARLAKAKGAPLAYNAYAYSVLDLLEAGKTQSSSGTALLFMVLREAWGQQKFAAANLVAIYESGHVLPGYVVQKDGVSYLYGIETTVGGRGRVVYGTMAQAMKGRLVRVVDADLYAYLELFKFEADNLVEAANEALRITAEKYGIKDPALLSAARFRREADYGKLGWSPFGFGTADITVGDRERAQYEEKAREDLPRPNPNATIFHKGTPDPKDPAPKDPKAPKTPAGTPVPSAAELDPVYPYREIKVMLAGDGKKFQCWDYRRRVWVDMPHTASEDPNVYYIFANPCAYTRANYEPLPAQLKIRLQVRPRVGIYGSSGYYDYDPDWEEDE